MTTGIDHAEGLAAWRASDKTRQPPPAVTDAEGLLERFHPDRRTDAWHPLVVGANAGDAVPAELAQLLQANSPIDDADIAGTTEITTDVLVLGAGGAGCAAALTAAGDAEVLVASKLLIGDGNTVMAEGGIQAAIGAEDSPQRHYADTMRGGRGAAQRDLVAAMVADGPEVIRWLIGLGVLFDRDETTEEGRALRRRMPGGATAARILSARDATGLEIMRMLREAVHLAPRISLADRCPAVELLTDEHGRCAGAVLFDFEHRRLVLARAAVVVLATGGSGQLALGGFPTSNHISATGDGLGLAYRLGARLRDAGSFQYHPTGLAWPSRMAGHLVSEAARSEGATLHNGAGERFVDELAARDVVTAAILQECAEERGVVRDGCVGVLLDTPSLEAARPGAVTHGLATLVRLGRRNGFDPTAEPVLVAPTLHYHNGGVEIDVDTTTSVPGLLCAGEVTGGVHGRNRLMGNALLDICAFGRRAGAAAAAASVTARTPSRRVGIDHLHEWRRNLTEAGLPLDVVAPVLFPEGVHSSFSPPAPVDR
jgi:L-aspartate oxidase